MYSQGYKYVAASTGAIASDAGDQLQPGHADYILKTLQDTERVERLVTRVLSPRSIEERAQAESYLRTRDGGNSRKTCAPPQSNEPFLGTPRPLALMAGKESAGVAALRKTALQRRLREVWVRFAFARPSGGGAARYVVVLPFLR